MGRRLVSVVGRVKGGPARGGTTRQIRFWDDEALSIASTVYARSSGGTVIAQPVIPNAGKQVFLSADRAAGDAFVIVTDVSPFSLGQIIPIFDAVNTVYKVITAITPATKRLDLDQTLGFAFTAATTKVNAPDMEGHIWGWLDDTTDHFGQVTETATTRKGPPLEFPTAVPLASVAVLEEGGAAGTRPAVNFIGRAITAVDNAGANRVDVTVGIAGTEAAPAPEVIGDTDTGLWGETGNLLSIVGFGKRVAQFNGTSATAVNYFALQNRTTGLPPYVNVVGTDADIGVVISSKGLGNVQLMGQSVSNNLALFIPVASSVNYLTFNASATTSVPFIATAGSDAVISHELRAKGNGSSVYLTQAGVIIFQAVGVASLVNYITATGAITANAPAIAPAGTDTNVDLYLRGKGSGGIGLATQNTDIVYVTGGTGTVTVAAIGGSASVSINLTPKGSGTLQYGGTEVARIPDVQVFTASGTWTKPTGAKVVYVVCIGGGGGGGGGRSTATTLGGGGGGGGAYSAEAFAPSALGSTETVTVGAAGSGGAGTAGATAGDGTTGGTSSFGTTPMLSAYGGGGGTGAPNGNSGAGGGTASAGSTTTGGLPAYAATGVIGSNAAAGGGAGVVAGGAAGLAGYGAEYGGAGGGSAAGNLNAVGAGHGGGSLHGGGGGGGAGQNAAGAQGGRNGVYAAGGGSGSGVAGTSRSGTGRAGDGGAGAAANAAGVNGGDPGGGGGGAGSANVAGGNGGRGEVIVVTWR